MLKRIFVASVVLMMVACAATKVEIYRNQKFFGDKMVQLNAPREAIWLPAVKQTLASQGVKLATRGQYAPVELKIRAQVKGRCLGGGFDFASFKMDVIDNSDGETLITFNSRGYSENCPPADGRIFEELGFVVNQLWQ